MLVITRGYMFTKHPSTLGTRCWSLRCSSYSVCWPRARHSCRPRTSLRWRSRWWDDFISGPGGPPMGGCPGSSYSTIDLLLYYFSSSSCYILYISYIILLYYDIIRLIWIIFLLFYYCWGTIWDFLPISYTRLLSSARLWTNACGIVGTVPRSMSGGIFKVFSAMAESNSDISLPAGWRMLVGILGI